MQALRAPGIEVETVVRDRTEADVLRPEIVGFAGLFERGPLFVPRRIDDWGEARAAFGGFFRLPGRRRRHAFGPLALYGFQQNGGSTAVVVRLGGRGMRAARATFMDPATGDLIGLVAASPGVWSNQTRLRLPLRVRARFAATTFPLAHPLAKEGALVRVRDASGTVVFGSLVAGSLAPLVAAGLTSPYVVEVIEPTVDVTIEGGGRFERFRELSLLAGSPRNVWRWLAAQRNLGPEWTPRVPDSWAPLDPHLELALSQQGPAASAILRAIRLPAGVAGSTPWPAATTIDGAWLEVRLGDGGDGDGDDAVRTIDAASFRSAIELLTEHPLPSVVAIPDLMLSLAPLGPDCAHEPDGTRFPDPPPPLEPCADPPAPNATTTSGPGSPPFVMPPEDEVPVLTVPGAEVAAVMLLQSELLRAVADHGDGRAERVALLDSRPQLAPSEIMADATTLAGEAVGYKPDLGALLYPWIRILDPASAARRGIDIPPSGHVAGLMARTTRVRGPSAPFANETLNGAIAVERALDYEARARLNLGQVSTVHAIPGRGVLVYGERTLSFEPGALRHVPPARVLAYVRRLLRVVGQTLVFEPNDRFLWLRIKVTIEAALQELFAAGAFAGRTPEESYRVRCDETTNPSSERGSGRVNTLVLVALAVPLEFITIRIAFTRDGARVVDDISMESGA